MISKKDACESKCGNIVIRYHINYIRYDSLENEGLR